MIYILLFGGLTILVLCIFLLIKKMRTTTPENDLLGEEKKMIGDHNELEAIVVVNKLENPQSISPKSKHEVKDQHLLGLVSSAIPAIAQGLSQTAKNNALKEQLKNIKDVYTVTLPSGGELAKSATKEGVLQGLSRGHGAIKEYADIREVDLSQLVSNNFKNLVNFANVLQVASMAVGQYYMSEIDSKISALNHELDQIQDFLENTMEANLKKDILVIKTLSEFSTEIFNNKNELNRRLGQIDRIEEDLVVVISQVNAKLKNLVSDEEVTFKEYKSVIDVINRWQNLQSIAVAALTQATQLKILLMTNESFEETYHTSLLDKSMVEVKDINKKIYNFHEILDQKFEIDFETSKRRVDIAVVSHILPKKKVESGLLELINQQKSIMYSNNIKEIQYAKQNDVHMIIEDGKLYYLENDKELID